MKTQILCALLLSVLAVSSHAGRSNYAEIGAGASKLLNTSSDVDTKKYINDIDPSPAIHVSTGSRLGRSIHSWFELSYYHSGVKKIGISDMSNQYLTAGLKFTTNPNASFSAFFKLGAGKLFSKTTTPSNADEAGSIEKETLGIYYTGVGSSFRINKKRSINFGIQSFQSRSTKDTFDNLFLVSLNQYL